MGCELWGASYGVRVTGCVLRGAGYGLQIINRKQSFYTPHHETRNKCLLLDKADLLAILI